MERSRQMVRGRESNKAEAHCAVPDGPSDGPSRATNHARMDKEPDRFGSARLVYQLELAVLVLKLTQVEGIVVSECVWSPLYN